MNSIPKFFGRFLKKVEKSFFGLQTNPKQNYKVTTSKLCHKLFWSKIQIYLPLSTVRDIKKNDSAFELEKAHTVTYHH